MPSVEEFDEPDEPPELELLSDDNQDDDDMVLDDSSDDEEFLEYDPSGRYGRYAEILGKGAMKTVYRAYDMVDCKEVAWNKEKPPFECSEEQAMAIRREIHLLQGLNHKGIIKLYSAWVDDTTGDTNFITELCSSTLLEYRIKHKHISRKAVKSWGRQILQGLAHLHMQEPPIIHRDLKCENIFVKCSSNTVLKIGDFGSATYLDETHHMHTLVGTPEFMAPEMFEEDYNELVDVYSFGMCMLELLTRECPYSECKNLPQIYKKVTSGEKPKALHKVKDVQALQLINRCLLPACKRPSASELLADPFLQCQEESPGSGQSMKVSNSMPNLRIPTASFGVKNMLSGHKVSELAKCCSSVKRRYGLAQIDLEPLVAESPDTIHKRALHTKSPSFRRSYRVMGKVKDQNTLYLKIRIQESSRSCHIDFPFDLRFDSPRSVAEEMVRALDYPESDLLTIADLISEEIAALVPNLDGSMLEQCQDDALNALPGTVLSNMQCSQCSVGEPNVQDDAKPDNECSELECPNNDKGPNVSTSERQNGEVDNTPVLKNDAMPSMNRMELVTGAMNGIITKHLPDKLLSSSVADRGSSSMTQLKVCADFPNAILDMSMASENDHAHSFPSKLYKTRTQFKQLPAGIGIVLWPSSEQGFRRAHPSYVNAFA